MKEMWLARATFYRVVKEKGAVKVKRVFLTCLVLFMIASIISVADCDPYTPSYTTYDTDYLSIVRMYIRVINGKDKKHHDLFNNLINMDYDEPFVYGEKNYNLANAVKKGTGFVITDIDHDGNAEMIIGHVGKQTSIYELFAMKDGKVKEVLRGGYRVMYYPSQGGKIYSTKHYAGGWSMSGLYGFAGNKVWLIDGMLENDNYGIELYGEDRNEGWWFRVSEGQEEATESNHVESAIAQSWISDQEANLVNIELLPLSLFEKMEETEQGMGMIQVNGKTTGSNKVNIRKKPEKKAKIAKKVTVGSVVTILDEVEDYYLVSYGSAQGYIQKEFVKVYKLHDFVGTAN